MSTLLMLLVFCLLAVGIPYLLVFVFPKLKYRFRDAKKAINDKLADPVNDHGHQIDDAKKGVEDTRRQVVEAITANKGLQLKVEASQRDIVKYTNLAKNAAAKGDEGAVTAFIKDKQRHEARAKTFARQIEANDHVIATVRKQVAERTDQIQNAEANKDILEAQLSGTQLRKEMAKVGSGLEAGDLGGLGSLQEHVDEETARAEAFEEVYGKNDVDLEAKYSAQGDSVNDEVAKLMAANQ